MTGTVRVLPPLPRIVTRSIAPMGAGVGDGERLGQAVRTLGRAHGAEQIGLGETFFFEKAEEGAHGGERAQQRAALQSFIAPLGQEGAQIRRLKRPQRGEVRQGALVFG